MPSDKPTAPVEIALLLLLGVLWGMPYALTKIALPTIPPVTMVAARVALAAAALWIVVLANRRAVSVRFHVAARLFFQGLIGCAVPYTLIAVGQRSVDSALASILNATGPLFVCLIGLLSAGREAPTATRLFGVMVGLGGVVAITGAGAFAQLGSATLGQLAILAATLSSAFAAIHARRFVALAPEIVAAATLSSAAVTLIPLSFVLESPLSRAPSAAAIAALLANALLATALGFVVYFRLIRTLGSMGTVSVGYLRPGVGVLIGCLFLGENLTWEIGAGLAVIFTGVAAINFRQDSRRAKAAPAGRLTLHGTAAAGGV